MMNRFRRMLSGRSLDVLFYASSWIDELWVRSSIIACREKNIAVMLALGSENALPSEAVALYARNGVPVMPAQGVNELRRRKARQVVTATTSVQREWFHADVRHLVHMPHSLASLQMIYPKDAFDAYDVLFAAGPQHEREFAALSEVRKLGGRRSYPVGYGKLDLLRDALTIERPRPRASGRHILLAPSWGTDNILNIMGKELVGRVLDAGHAITVRPHPSFFLEKDAVVEDISQTFAEREGFMLEYATGLGDAFFTADLLISDYSGSALEFATAREMPVIFIDVPPKVVNPRWREIGLEPVELGLRERIGELVPASADAVLQAVERAAPSAEAAHAVRECCYCDRRCADEASRIIATLLEE